MAGGVDRDTLFSNYQPVRSRTFAISLLVEFIGVLIFAFLGTTVKEPTLGPWVNGLALAICVYMAANISGGHLNPAVTMSTLMCGFYPLLHSVLYIILQVCGSIVGSLLASALVPGASVNMGVGGPGCFDPTTIHPDITLKQLFGWEVVMTFTLISVVYACGVAKPGHGSFTPLAVGLSLVACAGAGGQYTGAALNPARVLGPLAVFKCGAELAWIYVLAELLAAVLACSIFAFVSGFGPLNPLKSTSEFGLSWPEAVQMWFTGAPPKRLRVDGDENVTDLLERNALEEARKGYGGLLGAGFKTGAGMIGSGIKGIKGLASGAKKTKTSGAGVAGQGGDVVTPAASTELEAGGARDVAV